MMEVIAVDHPDPSWQVDLLDRRAILWVGQEAYDNNLDELISSLNQVLLGTWSAIFLDIPVSPTPEFLGLLNKLDDGLILRHYYEDPGPPTLPPNRIPVYWLRGIEGKSSAGDSTNPSGLLTRLEMLKKSPIGGEVFAIGASSERQLMALNEAAGLADAFKKIVIVAESELTQPKDNRFERIFHWKANAERFSSYLNEVALRPPADESLLVAARGESKIVTLDITHCVDPSHPITDCFEFVRISDIYRDSKIGEDDVRLFLEDPTASWLPYSKNVPYPRQLQYERKLLRYLKRFRNEGPSLTFTGWLPSEVGAGATTVLRQLAFNVSREGYPCMLAKPGIEDVDFRQLIAFFRTTSDLAMDDDEISAGLPWVIMFDTEQTSLHWESIRGLANGLKNLKKSAIVIGVREESDISLNKAMGANHKLGDELSNKITTDEGIAVGEHLGAFLPSYAKRSKEEWSSFINSTVVANNGNSDSLFWVALRFWLLRLPGTEGSIRAWLTNKFFELVEGKPRLCSSLLETAVLAKHRLFMPLELLLSDCRESINSIDANTGSFLGLRRIDHGRRLTFVHPLIADEILRVACANAQALNSVNMDSCVGMLDLELHLLGRIIERPYAGSEACLLLMEELVTTALRVDPRTSPRTYHVRDRIVQILERAHPSIWDTSQVFNHHVAKARRHLAIDPPNIEWTMDARREQLTLAQKHLDDAINNISPPEEEHRESELNLCVSMALALNARSKVERLDGQEQTSIEFELKADEFFERAQLLDADNSYVLENYARFKIRRAVRLDASEERTRLIVDAIQLLELEQVLDDFGSRVYQTTEELAQAYQLLDEHDGQGLLRDLADSGNEAAIVAVAKLKMHKSYESETERADAMSVAEQILLTVPVTQESWRSQLPLYRIVSLLRPYDFVRRLEILENISGFEDFPWPQQLKLEFAILLQQAGSETARQKGKSQFKRIRDELLTRSSNIFVPNELRYLRDPASEFREVLKTFIVVKNVSDVGKSSFGIPDGWKVVDVVFRDFHFGRKSIRVNDELDCKIQYTNFGPQAIPLNTKEIAGER